MKRTSFVLMIFIILFLSACAYGRGTPIPPYSTIYIRTFLDDPDAAAAATTLGLGTDNSPVWAGATFTGCATFGLNSAVFQPTTDSTTFFQVLAADGGTAVLNVDSTNEQVTIGKTSAAYPFIINSSDGSKQMKLYQDTSANIKWTDGWLRLETDEGDNTHTVVAVQGKGTGRGFLYLYDQDNQEYLEFSISNGLGLFQVVGSSPVGLSLQYTGDIPIKIYYGATEGTTQVFQIYGHGTGSGGIESLDISVERIAANTAEFYGLPNFLFDGSLLLGTTDAGTGAAGVLTIKAGTHPTTVATDCATFFVEDVVAGTAEMRVIDEAENESTLSPHNFSHFEPNDSYIYPWSYYAKNDNIGKEINVDMYGAIQAIEELSGKKLIYTKDIPKSKLTWDQKQEMNQRQKQLEEEIEVSLEEALEIREIMEEGIIEYVAKYRFDPNTATIVEYLEPVMGQVSTGRFAKQFRAGIRLDKDTGGLYRKKRPDEIVIDPTKFTQLPKWLNKRINQN